MSFHIIVQLTNDFVLGYCKTTTTKKQSYWCSTADPYDGGFLWVGYVFVDIHTLLQIQQQRYTSHECQDGV